MLGPRCGELDVVKQEMARVNVNISGISKLKWMRIVGEFNSDGHFIYFCGQEFLRRNEVSLIVNKSLKCSPWVQSQKWQNRLSWFPRKPFNITVIQVYAKTTDAKKGEVDWFYASLQHLLELTPKIDVLIIIEDWHAKVGSQEIPGVTVGSRQDMPRPWQGHGMRNDPARQLFPSRLSRGPGMSLSSFCLTVAGLSINFWKYNI